MLCIRLWSFLTKSYMRVAWQWCATRLILTCQTCRCCESWHRQGPCYLPCHVVHAVLSDLATDSTSLTAKQSLRTWEVWAHCCKASICDPGLAKILQAGGQVEEVCDGSLISCRNAVGTPGEHLVLHMPILVLPDSDLRTVAIA